jgi:hypothetical protein
MAYSVNETQVETICRAFFQTFHGGTQSGAAPNPDTSVSVPNFMYYTNEELAEGSIGAQGSSSRPGWQKFRTQAVPQYVAMHEMGLI